jgi:hypothetical protein
MNAAGSLETCAPRGNQAHQQAWDIPLGHPRRYDPLVTLPRITRAVDS